MRRMWMVTRSTFFLSGSGAFETDLERAISGYLDASQVASVDVLAFGVGLGAEAI